MSLKHFLIIFSMLFVQKISFGSSFPAPFDADIPGYNGNEILLTELSNMDENGERPNPLLKLLRSKQNKKLTAALLAFPFPFGIVGLHRIYLGCSPYVPVVYIASLGGAFGVLPLIDFFVILLDKNIDNYVNNKKVFMWVN